MADRPHLIRFERRGEIGPVPFSESLPFFIFTAEGFHDPDTREDFLQRRRHVAHLLLSAGGEFLQPLAHAHHRQAGQGKHDEGDAGQSPILIENDTHHGEKREGILKDVFDDV